MRFTVQDDFNVKHPAQLGHVGMARDDNASGEKPVSRPNHVLDQESPIQLNHKLVCPEASAHARCHYDAPVLCYWMFDCLSHGGSRFAYSTVMQA